MTKKRIEIKPLTGLRFFAALFVCMAHLIPKYVPGAPYVYSRLAAEGMSLFFVLSGFVIHYNYFSQISHHKTKGIYNFFVARFARLYPLFFVGICYDIYQHHGWRLSSELWSAMPYYLTLTQSWFYFTIRENALIYQFGSIPSVGWSVSTEWFFYIAYPVICFLLLKSKSIKVRLGSFFLISITFITFVWFSRAFYSEINQFAIAKFGTIADATTHHQDSFIRWMIYFSPYARIGEFIIGCITAAIFMQTSHIVPSKRENAWGLVALISSLLAIVVLHNLIFNAPKEFSWFIALHQCFGFAVPIAVVIFCVSRYNNFITQLLSTRFILLGGEISYSVYLLHSTISEHFNYLYTAFPAVFLFSYASYRIIEMPSRKVIRNLFAQKYSIGKKEDERKPSSLSKSSLSPSSLL